MRFFSVNEYDMDTPFDASQGRKPCSREEKARDGKSRLDTTDYPSGTILDFS
jgi:hypothetical protein